MVFHGFLNVSYLFPGVFLYDLSSSNPLKGETNKGPRLLGASELLPQDGSLKGLVEDFKECLLRNSTKIGHWSMIFGDVLDSESLVLLQKITLTSSIIF